MTTPRTSQSPTRTNKTEDQYWAKFKLISAACFRYKNNIPEPKKTNQEKKFNIQSNTDSLIKIQTKKSNQLPNDFISSLSMNDYLDFIEHKSHHIKKPSFNVYIASISHGLHRSNRPDDAETFLLEVKKFKTQCEPSTKKQNTSSLKLKKLLPKQVEDLKSIAQTSTKLIDRRVSVFILASLFTGLRPSEWANSIYEDGSIFALNGKNSNGRSTGDIRSVPVTTEQWVFFLRANGVEVTDDLLAFLDASEDDRIYYVRTALDQVSFISNQACAFPVNDDSEARKEKLAEFFASSSEKRFSNWKVRPSPYTGRHMFSANWKNVLSKESLAILLGHSSEETAGQHYARRVQGLPQFREFFKSIPSSDKPDQTRPFKKSE